MRIISNAHSQMGGSLQRLVDAIRLDELSQETPVRRAIEAVNLTLPYVGFADIMTRGHAAIEMAGNSATQFERGIAFGIAITLAAEHHE